MATLTPAELGAIRRECANALTVNYSKAQINAAAQAIEDWFEANRPAMSAAVNAATTPFVFSPAQKKAIAAHWLMQKFGREK